jgi:hypothetical protein
MLKFIMEFDRKPDPTVKNEFSSLRVRLEDDNPRPDEVRVFLDSFSNGSAGAAARIEVKKLCAKYGWNEADFMPRAQLKNESGLAAKRSVLAPKPEATKKYHP